MRKIMMATLVVLAFVSLHSMDVQKSRNFDWNQRSWVEESRRDLQSNGGTLISTGPSQSVQVGTDILERGGSAIDAALASALYRITLDI